MDTSQIIVTLLGTGLIGFVGWFFFAAPHRVATAVAGNGGLQQATIQVKGGYSPDVVEVALGQPVQLHFYRDETAGCSEELLLPDFGIRRELPAFQTTTVELRPDKAGTYPFTCGMGMLRGSLIVR
ncbi:cupredoxin domain-containing protein [Hymenobacter lapidiphilus]|uniref:Cupredoxin domain-containing protein n=1 Tax=Hymenobacter lapidiphilus TaxID=2608003 RepID=A0A7Y7U4K2_9BACT|nr:cupredoxin domain-containing protein [Hymenobacter lapidiphilus]NVO29774.1 cupredoxin domain-containing protein [Hymenobacter lapidiphilus]